MHVRGLGRGDVDRLHILDALCFEKPFRFSRASMRRFAGAPHAIVRLAVELDGAETVEALLGFCIVHLEPSVGGTAGYVVTLDVDPGVRGRGVATFLMGEMEAAAAKAGAAAMSLHVFCGNGAAISLYEKLGYRRVGAVSDFYGLGLHAFGYRRVLSEPGLGTSERGDVGRSAEAS